MDQNNDSIVAPQRVSTISSSMNNVTAIEDNGELLNTKNDSTNQQYYSEQNISLSNIQQCKYVSNKALKQISTSTAICDVGKSVASISSHLASKVVPSAEGEISGISHSYLYRAATLENNDQSTNNAHSEGNENVVSSDHLLMSTCKLDANTSAQLDIPLSYIIKAGKSEAIVAEKWVNSQLENCPDNLFPCIDMQELLKSANLRWISTDEISFNSERYNIKASEIESPLAPLARIGIDRSTLYQLGMPKDLVDRIYRALYVYSEGFRGVIRDIVAHCGSNLQAHVTSNMWLVYMALLEYCGDIGNYKAAILRFTKCNDVWKKDLEDAFCNENAALHSELDIALGNLENVSMRLEERNVQLAKMVLRTEESMDQMQKKDMDISSLHEDVRILELDKVFLEDERAKLIDLVETVRKEYTFEKSARVTAVKESTVLAEENRMIRHKLTISEEKRIETTNKLIESIRDCEELKQQIAVLEKAAVESAAEKKQIMIKASVIQLLWIKTRNEVTKLRCRKEKLESTFEELSGMHNVILQKNKTITKQLKLETEKSSRNLNEISKWTAITEMQKRKLTALEVTIAQSIAKQQANEQHSCYQMQMEELQSQKVLLGEHITSLRENLLRNEDQIAVLKNAFDNSKVEIQNLKRMYSSSQQEFMHAEHDAEQLRLRLQYVEQSYEKAIKSLSSLKERSKMYEENSKEKIHKLELQAQVAASKLHAVTIANEHNIERVQKLKSELSTNLSEIWHCKLRLDAAEAEVGRITVAHDTLTRERELQDNILKKIMANMQLFTKKLQNLLMEVKYEDYPVDEAIRDLLRLVKDVFSKDFKMGSVIEGSDDEVEPVEVENECESECPTENVTDTEGPSISAVLFGDNDLSNQNAVDTLQQYRRKTGRHISKFAQQIVHISRHRKTKLENVIVQLDTTLLQKTDELENTQKQLTEQLCIGERLTNDYKILMELYKLTYDRKKMLLEDLQSQSDLLFLHRQIKRNLEQGIKAISFDLVCEAQKTEAVSETLESLRTIFDCHVMQQEDLLCHIWRAYLHYLCMKSLNRDVGCQASVVTQARTTQTLVPQRNRAYERTKIGQASFPFEDSNDDQFIQDVKRVTEKLLPDIYMGYTKDYHKDDSNLHPPTKHYKKSDYMHKIHSKFEQQDTNWAAAANLTPFEEYRPSPAIETDAKRGNELNLCSNNEATQDYMCQLTTSPYIDIKIKNPPNKLPLNSQKTSCGFPYSEPQHSLVSATGADAECPRLIPQKPSNRPTGSQSGRFVSKNDTESLKSILPSNQNGDHIRRVDTANQEIQIKLGGPQRPGIMSLLRNGRNIIRNLHLPTESTSITSKAMEGPLSSDSTGNSTCTNTSEDINDPAKVDSISKPNNVDTGSKTRHYSSRLEELTAKYKQEQEKLQKNPHVLSNQRSKQTEDRSPSITRSEFPSMEDINTCDDEILTPFVPAVLYPLLESLNYKNCTTNNK